MFNFINYNLVDTCREGSGKKQASKPKPAAVKNIPTIDKIWDDTPIYQPLKSELQPEVNRTEYPRQLASTSADYARQSYN